MKKLIISSMIFTAAYLYMIMPRMANRPKEKLRRAFGEHKLYAHRGLWGPGTGPENSLPAFRAAVDRGYGIELDVHETRDGKLAVIHDFDLSRMTDHTGMVEDYTLAQLQQMHLRMPDGSISEETIPSFQDVLRLVDGRTPLIVEIKNQSPTHYAHICELTNAALSDYRGVYVIESFNPQCVKWFRFHRPDIVRGQLSDNMMQYKEFHNTKLFIPGILLQSMSLNCLSRPDFIAYNVKYEKNLSRVLDRVLFRGASAAWTVKNEAQLEGEKNHFDVFIFDSFIPGKGNAATV